MICIFIIPRNGKVTDRAKKNCILHDVIIQYSVFFYEKHINDFYQSNNQVDMIYARSKHYIIKRYSKSR